MQLPTTKTTTKTKRKVLDQRLTIPERRSHAFSSCLHEVPSASVDSSTMTSPFAPMSCNAPDFQDDAIGIWKRKESGREPFLASQDLSQYQPTLHLVVVVSLVWHLPVPWPSLLS
jgi:hypothetical protein